MNLNSELYKQHILDLYTHPHNKEEMYEPDIVIPAKNASCGDSYILYLKTDGVTIKQATFSGVGCAISQASASLLTDKLQGLSIQKAREITEESVHSMLGVEITEGRKRCALLLFRALEEALRKTP